MKVGKVLAIVGVGCLVLVVAVVVALVAGVRWLGTDPPDIVVRVEAPVQVLEGQDFEVKASVKNDSGRPRTLVDVDIADAYLAGIAVRAATPPFKGSSHVPVDDTISHSFDLTLPPHSDTNITFGMSAVHTGDFAGDFDFCIDSEVKCISYTVRTVVGPAQPR
jgi:hypothetical protein